MTDFVLGPRYVIDETAGLQNGTGGDADVLLTSLPGIFRTYLDTLGQSYSFATANGVARSGVGAVQITGTNTVSSLFFADSNNDVLNGDDSGILTLAGNHVFLYATSDPHIVIGREGNGAVANANGEVVFAVYLEAAANNLSATLWTIQYEAILNPDTGSSDEVVDLGNSLHLGAAGDFPLDFGTLASGQMLFGSFGNATLAVIVAGRDQALPSIDSVNTSQGGGSITIGINNQMFNPGEAAYFTFVEGLQPASGTTMPATGANQPGGVSAIDYTALHTSASASFTIVQIQGGGNSPRTNVQLHAYNTAMEETTAFLPGQGDADDVEVRIDPASIQVFVGGTQVTQGITVVQLAGGLGIDVRGVPVGATVRYTTIDSNGQPATHTRLMIENVDGNPFDIGGFSLGGPPTFTSVGQLIGFGDDGPTASIALTGNAAVADESTGANGADLGLALPDDEVGHVVSLANGARLIGWDQAVMVTTTGTATGTDGGTSTVTLTLGANNDSGLTTTDGTAILLSLEGGVVVGRAGTEAIFAIAIDAAGQVTIEQYDSIRHTPTPGFDTLASIAAGRVFATVTATDGDSDSASSSVDIGTSIGFEDDGPSASLTLNAVNLTVDESVGVDAGDPNAADEVGHGAGVIGWAQLSGEALFTTTRDYGEDEEGGTSAYSLRIQSALTTMSVSNTNSAISLVQDGANAVRGVSADGQYAFRIEIDAASGQVTFTQFVAIEHGNTGSADELSAALGSGVLYAVWTVTDGDSDSVAPEVDLGAIIHIEDDGPTASIALTGNAAVADESTGANAGDTGLAAPDDEVGHSVSLANGARLIGWDQAVMVTTTGTATGTDGGTSGVALTLGANNDSGLTTTDGTAILLSLEGGVVVGRAGTEAIFAIAIDANGQVTVEQYDSIRHTPTPGFDTLASIAAGRVFATVTANDGDSDSAGASVDIGASIGFEDDGPSATLTLNNVSIVVDESVGVDAGDPNAADEVGHGVGVIGWAQLSGEALFTTVRDYGEDEEGGTSAYSLRIQTTQTALRVSNTNSLISLVQDGANAVRGVSADGQYAFRIEIDSSSGQVTMTQFLALEHGDTTSVDELSAGLGSGLLYAVWTVTDGDSDAVAPEVDLGSIIRIEDDGPTLDPTTFDDLTVGNVVGTTVSDNVVVFDPGSDTTSSWRIADAPGAQGSGTSGFTWRYVDSTGDGVADANSVVGSLNGIDLYSMFIDSDGTYDFTLLGAVKGTNLRLDINDIKAGGPDTNFIEVGALNSDSFVRISGYRDPDGPGPLDPVAAAVNESNANVGVVNGNLDARESLVFQLYAPDGADADTLPDLQVISGITIGTKTPKATTYTYTAYLNGVEVGGMINVQITTGKNGMLVIDAPQGVFFDTIEITSVNGNAVKVGLGDISIRIQPPDYLLGFTFELGDGDSDPASTAVTVGIDGNGDGVVSGVTTTFAAPEDPGSDIMMMRHLHHAFEFNAAIESQLIQMA
jgi:Domain of unknown function (DUF5801)